MTATIFISCITAFVGGAIYEMACVGWVHYSESNQPLKTALFSMLCATSQVIGIGLSVTSFISAPFFILGYGVGSFIAVKVKSKNHIS